MLLRVIVLCTLVAYLSVAQPGASIDTDRIDQIATSLYKRNQFMGSILLTRAGKVVFEKRYGSANLEWNVPFTPETKFRVGSITKQITAAAILLLQERGRLNVNDAVTKFMANAPPSWRTVTIHQLLSHTSGIPSYTEFPELPQMKLRSFSPAELVDTFRQRPLDFVPGERWKYSNSGYSLLGHVIEQISSQTYAEFVSQNIFKPLGMSHSGVDNHQRILLGRASGYEISGDGLQHASYLNMTTPYAAGAVYSTTSDLRKWVESLYGGKLLHPASLKAMTTPVMENYGYGLRMRTIGGRKSIYHGGAIDGFSSFVSWTPSTEDICIVLSNVGSMAYGSAPDLGTYIARIATGEAVTVPVHRGPITLSRDVLEQYVGKYDLGTSTITIALEDGQLVMRAASGGRMHLLPESANTFVAKEAERHFTFTKRSSSEMELT